MKTPLKIVALFIALPLMVIMVATSSFQAFEQITLAAEARQRTHLIIHDANQLLSDLKDAETGQRGYALTGDAAFLEPYLAIRDAVVGHLQKLRQLTLIPTAGQHLDTIAPLVEAKMTELAQVIDLRRKHDLEAVTAIVRNSQGKRMMDNIRTEMNGFIQTEETALVQNERTFQANMRDLFAIIVAASMVTLLFAIWFAILIYRETQQKAKQLLHLETESLLKVQKLLNTQLQQGNGALVISEEKLTVTLNSIGDAVIATDITGRVTFINPVSAQLTGWSQTEAVGLPVDDIFHIINKDTRQPALIPVMDALTHGKVQGLANHTVLIARDGREYDISDSCAPIRDREQVIVGAVLVFRDVTEDYAIQQVLHDKSVLVETILNTVVDGIITLHAKNNLIETVNPGTEHIFGYTATELIGQNFSLLIPEFHQDIGEIYFDKAVQTLGIGFDREAMGRHKDGSDFPLEITLSEMWLGSERYFTAILRDITVSRRLAEDSRRFFTLSQEMLCVIGFDGYFKSLNPSWEKALGYTATELFDKPFIAFIHPSDQQATREEVERLANGDNCSVFQNRYLCKDGSIRYFSWDITTVTQEHLFYCSARDITARKHSETEQKRLHERAQLALDAGQLGDWSWDATTDQVSLGVLAARIFGFPEGISITRAQLRERLSPEDAEQARKTWDQALSEHTDYRNEYRAKRPDGYCWIAMTGRGNYAEDGKVLGMNGVMQDINERKLAELTKLRLAAIVESSDDAIISKDLQGIITTWNTGAEKIFGYTANEMIGQPISRLIPTQRQKDDSVVLGQISSGVSVRHFETVRLRKDGSCVDVSITMSAIKDGSGTVIGASKVARDISERKLAEAKLHEAMVIAEKANLAKSEFLSSMSHELRTPLNAILGFAQLLESGKPLPTDTQMLRLQEIIKAGWYLLELINEVLDLALIESGKLSLSPEPVMLKGVLLECMGMIEPQAEQHGITLSLLPFDPTWFVYADHTRVKQVLINLLSNAIKYNREQGSVVVTCDLNTPETIRISVKDSGTGLPPEKLAQLFQPFNRLGQEHGTQEGTGIGLVVTKKLVELMGGSIGVISVVGVGSEFWIDLLKDITPPIAVGQSMTPKSLAAPKDDHSTQQTLLYVEDNPANLLLVEQIIADHSPLHMRSARDGTQGIALARTQHPDIILMDINLPGISGFKALKILRDDPMTAHIPVIALSANAMTRDIEKGLAAGFFRYLTKPIKVNELMDTLDEALKVSNAGLDDTLIDTSET
ncbi:MAG: PAS domain S-box protein [Methylococcaceae bacterium]|nr:PAS domain S-box protein [Methylococcaceae bacterium]